ncbi:MAG: M23 family metallopeptidase [Leptospirales bacterium]|nr:M23 family metallopeptidase [Leptospirales bacterium]HMZ36718.1 M23 family metallopeptidase [Leptospiraceae bacterium]
MKSRLLFFLFAISAAGAFAQEVKFSWPMERGFPELRGLTSTFGESRGDHFHNGVDISSLGEPVHPVAPGKILFARGIEDDPFSPLIGPGNFVIVDHGKGWWSGYYHLGKITKTRKGAVEPNSTLGVTGNTGHSVGAHLHFFLARDYGRTLVNPLVVLPGIVDKNPPQIGSLTIVTPQGKTTLPAGSVSRVRLSQPFPVYAQIQDPGLEKNTNRGIYELRWKLNDAPEQIRNFQKIVVVGDEWTLEGKGFEDVFGMGQYHLGALSFQNGRNTVRITAVDQAGNQSTETFEIDVQRMY